MNEPKHIMFVPNGHSESGKTGIWDVIAKATNWPIGEIKWYGSWRCYAFFAGEDTIFEKTCLRDIADFCEEQTKLHRKLKI